MPDDDDGNDKLGQPVAALVSPPGARRVVRRADLLVEVSTAPSRETR